MVIVSSSTTALLEFFHNDSGTDNLRSHSYSYRSAPSRRKSGHRPRDRAPHKRAFDADKRVITAPTLCSRNSLIMAIFYAFQSNFLFYESLFICYSLSLSQGRVQYLHFFRVDFPFFTRNGQLCSYNVELIMIVSLIILCVSIKYSSFYVN